MFLDGDQERKSGCLLLPGDDAPERVVFEVLRKNAWPEIASRTGRSHSEIVDALDYSMTLENHHDCLKAAADKLVLGIAILWQAMASIWATKFLAENEKREIAEYVDAALNKQPFKEPEAEPVLQPLPVARPPQSTMF